MTSINFYKITSPSTNKVYVGSTKHDINERLQIHEANYRKFKDGKYNYTASFEILEFKDCKIELLENKICQSKEERDMVECEFIVNTPNTVNKNLPGRTREQYYQDNKQEILIYQNQYYRDNKEQRRQYYQDNKRRDYERQIQYNRDNKEQQRQYRQVNEQKIKEKHNCLCGGKYTYSTKSRHFKSAKHNTYHIRNEQKQN